MIALPVAHRAFTGTTRGNTLHHKSDEDLQFVYGRIFSFLEKIGVGKSALHAAFT